MPDRTTTPDPAQARAELAEAQSTLGGGTGAAPQLPGAAGVESRLLDVRNKIEEHKGDSNTAIDEIKSEIRQHLQAGRQVSMWFDGKETAIVGFSATGMPIDSRGLIRGMLPLAMGRKGTKNGVEFKQSPQRLPETSPAPAAPKQDLHQSRQDLASAQAVMGAAPVLRPRPAPEGSAVPSWLAIRNRSEAANRAGGGNWWEPQRLPQTASTPVTNPATAKTTAQDAPGAPISVPGGSVHAPKPAPVPAPVRQPQPLPSTSAAIGAVTGAGPRPLPSSGAAGYGSVPIGPPQAQGLFGTADIPVQTGPASASAAGDGSGAVAAAGPRRGQAGAGWLQRVADQRRELPTMTDAIVATLAGRKTFQQQRAERDPTQRYGHEPDAIKDLIRLTMPGVSEVFGLNEQVPLGPAQSRRRSAPLPGAGSGAGAGPAPGRFQFPDLDGGGARGGPGRGIGESGNGNEKLIAAVEKLTAAVEKLTTQMQRQGTQTGASPNRASAPAGFDPGAGARMQFDRLKRAVANSGNAMLGRSSKSNIARAGPAMPGGPAEGAGAAPAAAAPAAATPAAEIPLAELALLAV